METPPTVTEIGSRPSSSSEVLTGRPDDQATGVDVLDWQMDGHTRHVRRNVRLRTHPKRSGGTIRAEGSAPDDEVEGRVIRVLLAEPARLFRDALAGRLGLERDIQVVAKIDAGHALVATALETRPDVAVIDAELAGNAGFEAVAELHRRLPECRTLLLAGAGQPGVLRRALSAQVVGFMVKDVCPGELVNAIRELAAGARVVDPQLMMAALSLPRSPLTERETEVLRSTASGAELPEIAAELSLSYGTVRNYLASAVTKLSARNRVDAIRIAGEAGWI